ncbi:hypothetical protein LZ30DRAFT_694560 [Colletotrichum cereale]|nr:hypothetical protein LZ30DRAFT_694560 [Colletotrichum cereale]
MRTTTSYIFGAALLATSVQAAGFCQEWSFTDGKPCTKVQDGSFSCQDNNNAEATVKQLGSGLIQVAASKASQAGVKLDCGTNTNKIIYFVEAGMTLNFTNPACDGPALAGITGVQSAKPLLLPGLYQEFNLTDGDACKKEADGSYLCGDSSGATIRQNNGVILMTSGQSDAAIKVSCNAGSSIYFCSGPGGSTNFTQPICGGNFDSVVSVKSAAPILRPSGLE